MLFKFTIIVSRHQDPGRYGTPSPSFSQAPSMAHRPNRCSGEEDRRRSRAVLSPVAHREESVLCIQRIVGYILVLLDRAHSMLLDIPVVAIGVKSKAVGRLAARSSMQGAIIDDEGLALLNRNSDCLDATNAFVLELKAAEVVPNAVLSRVGPGARASRCIFSNPVADILESLPAPEKHAFH